MQTKRDLLVDLLFSLAALTGLAISAYWGFSLRTEVFAASDLKTVYASTWCFVHRQSAYSITNLQAVFAANRFTPPPTWFGHAPVYPPTTLMLLAPFAFLPMVPALYAALFTSVLLLALGLTALLSYAKTAFGLNLVWRAAAVVLFSAGPLLGFALTMGNLSVPTTAFVLAAFCLRKHLQPWLCAAVLTAAMLLKPHMAVWPVIAMLLLPDRVTRRVAFRSILYFAGAVAITFGWLSFSGTLSLQARGYLHILHMETSGGASMSSASREVLPVISQITSLSSLLGFYSTNGTLNKVFSGAFLLALAAILVSLTLRVRNEKAALLATALWCAFGMLATYHRAHDATLLLLILPWLLSELRSKPNGWHAWAVLLLYSALSVGPDLATLNRWFAAGATSPLISFLLLRQASLAESCLVVVLLTALWREYMTSPERLATSNELIKVN